MSTRDGGCVEQGVFVECSVCPRVTCIYDESDSEVSEDDWAENSQEIG